MRWCSTSDDVTTYKGVLIQGWEMCGNWKVFYGGYCSCHGVCAEPYEGQFKAGVDNENLWTKYVDNDMEFVQMCNFGL